MALIKEQLVEVRWHGMNKKKFESLGYTYTKLKDSFFVPLEHLTKTERYNLKFLCDECGKLTIIKRRLNDLREDKIILCENCDMFHPNNKHKIMELISNKFKERGYTLIPGQKYKTVNTKYNYNCEKHGDKEIVLQSFLSGVGCMECGIETVRLSKIKYIDMNYIRERFLEKNMNLLPNQTYKGSEKKLKYTCLIHKDLDVQEISWYKFDTRKQGCYLCGYEKNRGEGHPNWKNGISSIHAHLRGKLIEWKKDSRQNCGFKCVITGERFDDIHHLYSFDSILQETLREINLDIRETASMYTEEELKSLEEKCLEIHYRYPLGVCLREDVHELFHELYKYGENTPEQFEEFKLRWRMGEFKELFKKG